MSKKYANNDSENYFNLVQLYSKKRQQYRTDNRYQALFE